jgi:hypothetical protein
MSPQQQQQQAQSMRQAQENHYKDPTLNNVSQGSTSSTTTTSTTTTASTSTTTPVLTTTSAAVEDIPRRPYPLKPSTKKAATAYSLFSDPTAFELDTIRNKTHYLSSSLSGKIWWDVNGDAKRGDYGNATLNESRVWIRRVERIISAS